MLTIIFLILLISVMANMISLSIRMAWGLSRILVRLVFLPVTLIVLAFSGLVQLVIGILLIVGLVSLVSSAT